MNIFLFDADTIMNMDTFIGIASRSSDCPLKRLERVVKMPMDLKKWEPGKDWPGNNLPRKIPI